MHNHTQKKMIMRKGEINVLNHSKTNLQPSRGRHKCLDVFRDARGVPIYRLTRRKTRKNTPQFWCALAPLKARYDAYFSKICVRHGAHVAHNSVGSYSNCQDVRKCASGPPEKCVAPTRSVGATIHAK